MPWSSYPFGDDGTPGRPNPGFGGEPKTRTTSYGVRRGGSTCSRGGDRSHGLPVRDIGNLRPDCPINLSNNRPSRAAQELFAQQHKTNGDTLGRARERRRGREGARHLPILRKISPSPPTHPFEWGSQNQSKSTSYSTGTTVSILVVWCGRKGRFSSLVQHTAVQSIVQL